MVQPVYDNQGFIALIGVLVAGSIAVTVASAVLFFGSDFSRSALLIQQSYQAKALARACADSGLLQLHNNTSFSGTGSLTLGRGSCSYTVANLGGNNRRVQASGTIGNVVRKMEISINAVTPRLNVASWQEVADFTP
ncbi:MAG: hypothetical protein V1664_02140 [Candidatus Uhrbacteria bacterium]